MTKLIIILLSAVFINNYVLSKFLGICPFLGVSKKLDSATGMSLAVIFVMLLATAATYPIQFYLLEPNNLGYLQTIVFILVIAALVQLVEIVLKRYIPSLHQSLGVYLPLITTNCAVLGVTILNVQDFPVTETTSFCSGLSRDRNYIVLVGLYAVYDKLVWQRLGIPAGYGNVLGRALSYRGLRCSQKLQRSADHPRGCGYNITLVPRLRRSYREPVRCIRGCRNE